MNCPKCKKKMRFVEINHGDYYRDADGDWGPINARFICEKCLIYKEVELKEM